MWSQDCHSNASLAHCTMTHRSKCTPFAFTSGTQRALGTVLVLPWQQKWTISGKCEDLWVCNSQVQLSSDEGINGVSASTWAVLVSSLTIMESHLKVAKPWSLCFFTGARVGWSMEGGIVPTTAQASSKMELTKIPATKYNSHNCFLSHLKPENVLPRR